MFEQATYTCPRCGFAIAPHQLKGETFVCGTCQGEFRTMTDPETGRIALFESEGRIVPEPLYLPKGSIRAAVALAMAFSCWALIVTGGDVPGPLFGVLLTVVGYYFGFRMRVKEAASRIYDPGAHVQEPLFLPGGCIRTTLMLGFGVSAVVLHSQGRLVRREFLEFFVVLAGLIGGHLFARAFAGLKGGAAHVALSHVKGASVLCAAAWLTILFLSGGHAQAPPTLVLGLCCVQTFYYGSRS